LSSLIAILLRPPRETHVPGGRPYRDRRRLRIGFVVQLLEEDVEFGNSISLGVGEKWQRINFLGPLPITLINSSTQT
jgi:hypothetical protein